VKAGLAADNYLLYTAEDVFYETAMVPTYKCSVMMNALFRNIKENANLDLLEESDDDEEFENTQIESLPEDCVGFVYLITNLITGRKYIGKKLAKFSKTTYKVVKLKNGTKKKKKIRSKIDSDWLTYYGSNDELNKDIQNLGSENFQRDILYYCTSKAQCSYIEAREQFRHQVLESDAYYNGQISVRVHGSHIKNKLSS
jgi:hypothetical protein